MPSDRALEIWTVDLDAPAAVTRELEGLLSEPERARAGRFVRASDRRRYIVAHAGLRCALSRYLDVDPRSLAFVVRPEGKPELADAGGKSLSFNLSHSGELALIGVTGGSPLGIDVEELRRIDDAMAIARHFFSPAELAALAALPPEQAQQGFLNCWTRKEAFVKALGGGLSIPLDAFDVAIERDRPAVTRIAGDVAGAGCWGMVHLEPAPGYVGAAVVEGGPTDVIFREFACAWDPAPPRRIVLTPDSWARRERCRSAG